MWVFIVALSISAIVATLTIIIVRSRKGIRKRYLHKSRSEIIEARVFAKKHFILSLCLAFIAPIPLSFIISFFINDERIRDIFMALVIIIGIGSIILAVYWWNVEGVVRSLLDELNDSSINRAEE